jgi:hypothetical protein
MPAHVEAWRAGQADSGGLGSADCTLKGIYIAHIPGGDLKGCAIMIDPTQVSEIFNENGLRADDVLLHIYEHLQMVFRIGRVNRQEIVDGENVIVFCTPQAPIRKERKIILQVVFGVEHKSKLIRVDKPVNAMVFEVIQRDNKTVRLSMWLLDTKELNVFGPGYIWNETINNFSKQGEDLTTNKTRTPRSKRKRISLPDPIKRNEDAYRWVVAFASIKEDIEIKKELEKDYVELNNIYQTYCQDGFEFRPIKRNTWDKIIEWGKRKGKDYMTIIEFQHKYKR